MRIGEIELHMLSDGMVSIEPGGPFGLVPRVLYEQHYRPDSAGLLHEHLNCLLVRSEGKTILIDTGLGPKLSEKEIKRWRLDRSAGDLVEHMGRHGVQPEEVDIVINTHLHWDHCGGNTVRSGPDVAPRFPNATYYVRRLEWSEAKHPNARTQGTYFEENFTPLVKAGRMRLLHYDLDITPHVRCVLTPGHTRGHQSVLLRSGDWRGLFVADMASYSIHMAKAAWLTAYDVLPVENIRTKERWQRWALDRDAWLFFQHDPYLPVGRLREGEKGLAIEAVEEAGPITAELPIREQPVG